MTLVSGIRSGLRSGIRSGLNPSDAVDPMAGVSRDAARGVYCPASDAEWTIAMSVAGITSGNPSHLWLLQEAAGNPADSIGAATFTATGVNYLQTVSGWTRKAIGTDHSASDSLVATDASLPDISTTSALFLMYAAVATTPAGNRGLAALGAITTAVDGGAKIHVNTTPALLAISGASAATGATIGTGVMPMAIHHNQTANFTKIYTETEKLEPVFGAGATGKLTQIGLTSSISANARFLYAVEFTGAAAEMTPAQFKTLLSTLAWSPTWTP